MNNKRTHNVVATIGTYTTPDGEEKKRYQNCGMATTNDKGQISIKLNATPVAPEWNGWLNLYSIENDNQSSPPRQQQPPRQQPQQNFQVDDDIPF